MELMAGDRSFLEDFESGRLPKEAFRHRDHVRLAFLCLRLGSEAEAAARVERGIRAFARRHGVEQLYHATITLAWLRLVADAVVRAGRPARFDVLAAACPELLDKGLITRYYSAELLAGDRTKRQFVEPDLAPLPSLQPPPPPRP